MDLSSLLPSSLGLGGEFQTRVGGSIERATSENLVSPDWAANMQICDEEESSLPLAAKGNRFQWLLYGCNPDADDAWRGTRNINRTAEGATHAAKALKRRLKSDNPKMLQLTLTLCEAAVKNCHRTLHEALGTREFLNEVAILTNGQKGYEVRRQALAMIQDWGIAFGNDRSLAYGEVYARLKAQGARFPPSDGAPPVFTPPSNALSGAKGGGGGGGGGEPRVTSTQTMEKLEADLRMVSDKITLCRQMLPQSEGVEKDEALSEVVGFLEACRPRMVDLVEAGIGGSLGEEVFNKCLEINDALLRTLDAEREGTPIPVDDSGKKSDGTADLLDLDGGGKDSLSGKLSSFSIGEADDDEDDFVELRKAKGTTPSVRDGTGKVTKLGAVPLKPSEPSQGGKPATTTDDDLDDFLKSLTDDVSGSTAASGAATTGSATGAGAGAGTSTKQSVEDEFDKFLV